MAVPSPSSLSFNVNRRQTTLVRPSFPTPADSLPLSDIEDHDGFRVFVPFVFFYAHNPAMADKDPAEIIRTALADALVHYYPLAGRLREGSGRKLNVECTGEGILFADADVDILLEQIVPATTISLTFPCIDQLLLTSPESEKVVGGPLMLVQVTRLACKGFVLAIRFNHTVMDAKGLTLFLAAVGEAVRGGAITPPPWSRELLLARNPPSITRTHHGYNDVSASEKPAEGDLAIEEQLHQCFFFGAGEISSLRRVLQRSASSTTSYSAFDAVAAVTWKCLAAAWGPNFADDDEVRFYLAVDARQRLKPGSLPVGYYGNVVVIPATVTTAGELRLQPASYAADLIRGAKMVVDDEYIRSLADLMSEKDRPAIVINRVYAVSDLTRTRLGNVDFGWGEPVYGGPARGGCFKDNAWGFHVKYREGILVPLCLPNNVMKRFKEELQKIITSCSET